MRMSDDGNVRMNHNGSVYRSGVVQRDDSKGLG